MAYTPSSTKVKNSRRNRQVNLHSRHQSSPSSSSSSCDPDLQRAAVMHSFNNYNNKEEQQWTLSGNNNGSRILLAHANSFASLPSYKTPPSALKTDRPFNPFNRNLMERLESATFSPTVFKNVISPSEVCANGFRWTIDDVSLIKPARIEETSSLVEDGYHDAESYTDNETEQSVQEAIQRYFSKVEIPSPWDAPRHCSSPLSSTPPADPDGEKKCASRLSKSSCPATVHASTQTCWSFPVQLPDEVEAILKPYFQACSTLNNVSREIETDEESLSTSSLRRKLSFSKVQHDDDERFDSDDENMSCDRFSLGVGVPRSVRPNDDFCSPVSSRFRAVTPLMPMLSPPDVSPIINTATTTTTAQNSTHSKLSTRLNFTTHAAVVQSERTDKNRRERTPPEDEEECDTYKSIKAKCDKYRENVTEIKSQEDEDRIMTTSIIMMDDNSCTNTTKMGQSLDLISVTNNYDTGYHTQNSNNDKTGYGSLSNCGLANMEITDSANTSLDESYLIL